MSDPQYSIPLQFEKQVGLTGDKKCNVQVTMSKNFFLAGEMAYFMVDVDNSECTEPCSLTITHKVWIMFQNIVWKKLGLHESHKKERFFLAGPGEKKQVVLKF